MNTEKNQGWHYDTSSYPQLERDGDMIRLKVPKYHQFNVERGDPLTMTQYIDVMITAITGVPIDQVDIKITTEQLNALKRKHGKSIDKFFTEL